jgi:hypothetical protein
MEVRRSPRTQGWQVRALVVVASLDSCSCSSAGSMVGIEDAPRKLLCFEIEWSASGGAGSLIADPWRKLCYCICSLTHSASVLPYGPGVCPRCEQRKEKAGYRRIGAKVTLRPMRGEEPIVEQRPANRRQSKRR